MGSLFSTLCFSTTTDEKLSQPESLPSPEANARYEDNFTGLTLVAESDYSRVYRATDQRTGETVAVKTIDLFKVDHHVEEECLNLARCFHTNIVGFKEVRRLLHPLHLVIFAFSL